MKQAKKGISLAFNSIAVAVLVLIVVVVLTLAFTNLFGQQKKWLSEKISNIDNIADNTGKEDDILIPLTALSIFLPFFLSRTFLLAINPRPAPTIV